MPAGDVVSCQARRQYTVCNVFAADIAIHRALVAGAAELDDDVVDDAGKALIAHQSFEQGLPRCAEPARQRHHLLNAKASRMPATGSIGTAGRAGSWALADA